jgi:hypothetical protein
MCSLHNEVFLAMRSWCQTLVPKAFYSGEGPKRLRVLQSTQNVKCANTPTSLTLGGPWVSHHAVHRRVEYRSGALGAGQRASWLVGAKVAGGALHAVVLLAIAG